MKQSLISANKGDVVTVKISKKLESGMTFSRGEEWTVSATSGSCICINKRGAFGTDCWVTNIQFSEIFYGHTPTAEEDKQLEFLVSKCRKMEFVLKGIMFDTAGWCERCIQITPGKRNEKGIRVCDECGAGEGWTADIEFGDETNEYVVTYELNSALWDRDYLLVEVYDWMNQLFLDPFERKICAYTDDWGCWKENLLYVYENVDEAVCDRLLENARRNISNWAKDPENWAPKI